MERPTSTPLRPTSNDPADALKYSSAVTHPVQKIEASTSATQSATRRKLQAAAYGSALPMREMMHEHMLAQCHRLPGLPSSFATLESYTGQAETIDFDDFLELPHEKPDLPRLDPRDTLEALLAIRTNKST